MTVLRDHRGPHDVGSTCVARTMHHHPLGDAVGTCEVPTEHSVGPGGRGSKSLSVRKPFPHLELLGWPSVPHLWGWRGKNRGLDPMQQGAFLLLLCDGAEDTF
jgi:hypothetical protein